MPTKEQILDALRTCKEPELGKDIVTLDMVKNIAIEGGKVSFDYVLTTPACPLKDGMEKEARAALAKVPGVSEVSINMTASVNKDLRLERVLPPGVKNIIAVGSGKGGVGKSSVAANLAVCLAKDGAKVGMLDADVYGPNQPQMLGVEGFKPVADQEDKIDPAENHGVKVFSMGFLMDPDTPAIWRGPMLHGAITQFLKDVRWGDLDYLIVDLPPGTGDVQLSLCQTVPLVGAVIVTTPQSIAISDVRKAVAMFKKLNVPLLGLVENMSGFVCTNCSHLSHPFKEGGAKALAEKHLIPFLGAVPLDGAVCESGEVGTPLALSRPDSPTAAALRSVARQVAAQVSLQNHRRRILDIETVAS
ncbi:MAG: Mrp/NBP35 family ATP-binding protein [Elusimicrobia bacterium]|nr:Mrp/NBP35 family ATP-binding protein [Elusimicrobiota bacterium]